MTTRFTRKMNPSEVAGLYSPPTIVVPALRERTARAAIAALNREGYIMVGGILLERMEAQTETIREALNRGEIDVTARQEGAIVGPYVNGEGGYVPTGVGVWRPTPVEA